MAQCKNDLWQPTFVHDIDRPDGPYYVMENGQFVKLKGNTGAEWTAHACELIRAYGVRNRTGYTTCEDYTRIQCGCQRGVSEGNSTCARFLAGH